MAAKAETFHLDEALSLDEREALSRFVAQIIVDVEKVSALFESRGADATAVRSALAHLRATLTDLRSREDCADAEESLA